MNNLKILFLSVFLLVSCDERNYRSEKIEYKITQDSALPLGKVLNNIKFRNNQYVFVFNGDELRRKLPLEKVVYGGEDLELGYILDNIATDYRVRFSVINNLITVKNHTLPNHTLPDK